MAKCTTEVCFWHHTVKCQQGGVSSKPISTLRRQREFAGDPTLLAYNNIFI